MSDRLRSAARPRTTTWGTWPPNASPPFVGSGRGAVLAFRPARFLGPPSEPGMRLSTHPALHTLMPPSCVLVSATRARISSTLVHVCSWLRCAGIHQRPPGMTTPALRACCRPSPCGRLSRPRTTTAAPPHPRPSTDDAPARSGSEAGQPRMVPTFTTDRSTEEVPNCAPAASPRVRRSPSPWPPCRRFQPAQESPRPARRAPLPSPYPPGWSW
jgi:hypothetical protein